MSFLGEAKKFVLVLACLSRRCRPARRARLFRGAREIRVQASQGTCSLSLPHVPLSNHTEWHFPLFV